MTRWFVGLGALAALFLATGPGAAQDPVSSYHLGEHVQVKPTPWQDVWEEGVIRDFSYDHSQLIIRSASADRAFNIEDVRHAGSGGPASDTGRGAPAGAAGLGGQATPVGSARGAQAAGGDRNGERVSVAVGGACCYDGTIIGSGSGSAAGMYLIHYDHPGSLDAYAQPKFIYPFGTRNPTAAATGRGKGSTRCVMSYQNGIPICLPVAAPH